MAIFPKKLGTLPNDPGRAVKELAAYVRYMAERLEFEADKKNADRIRRSAYDEDQHS